MPRESRLVLIACYLAIFAIGENSTAIMAALPVMSRGLGLAPAVVEWAVNAYLLAAAAFIILGGRAADSLGPRRSSAAGIALFALASLLIASASNGLVLVAARTTQGLGAAFAVAGSLAAATRSVPEADRPSAIGGWTGFLMLGFSIGPLLGGAITHYAGWRINFWLNLLALLPAALILWRASRGEPRRPNPVDWRGLLLLAVLMVALITGLHALSSAARAPWAAAVPLVLAAAALTALYRTETHHDRPLLDFALFANRNFALACLLGFLLMFAIMALLLYYNLFAQSPAGFAMTPIGAGLSLLPLSVALFGFARAAPVLGNLFGIKLMMAGGALILVLGCAIVWLSLAVTGLPILLLGLFAAGLGIALPFASSSRIGLAALPQTQAGQGSGMLNAASFLGGTVGVTSGGIAFTLAGLPGVLLLVAICALACAALALRLR